MQNKRELLPNQVVSNGAIGQEPLLVPPIAGFWRRFLAWLVDVIILGVAGHIIGIMFARFLFKIGPYGRPLGLLFILPYFGLMNSEIGEGQTLGKRLMNIAVRDARNESISVPRSLARIAILALFPLFNGWAIPLMQKTLLVWFSSLIVLGLGGAIVYTMVFNRTARQGIHDLLVGTYVVHLLGEPVQAFPKTPRFHWKVAGIWLGVVAVGSVGMMLFAPSVRSSPRLATAVQIFDVLQDDSRFFTVTVNDRTFSGAHGKTSRVLIIEVWYKGLPEKENREAVAAEIIRTVFENATDVEKYDGIQVNITSAYDIGVAKAHVSWGFWDSIEGWRKRVAACDVLRKRALPGWLWIMP